MAVSERFWQHGSLQAGIHKVWGLAHSRRCGSLMPARSWPLGIAETTSKCLKWLLTPMLWLMQKKLNKAVANHLAPSHQEDGVYQVIEEYLGIDPLGTSERKELDGGTTVRRLALKGAGENHNNLSGTQSSPSERAWFDLYRRLHRRVFPPFMNYYKVRSIWSIGGVRGYKTDLLRKHLDAHVFGTAVDQIFLLIGTNDIGKEISSKGNLRQCRSGLTSNHAGLFR